MDILFLNWKDVKNPEVGGAEIIAFEFARRLVKDGHSVTFFSRSFKDALSREVIDGVDIIRKGNKLTVYAEAFFYYQVLKRKPDRVIDMVNTLCWQTPLYVEKNKRIAYVNQLAKEVLFYELSFPISFFAYFLERFEYLPYRNTKTLCYSESTKKDLIDFGIKRENIHIFPMGLDHNRYKPSQIKSKDPLFIFVARLVSMKRPRLCIEAMKIVIKEYPEAKLAIIGNGREEKIIDDIIKRENLSENVFLVNKDNFFIDKHTKDVKVTFMQRAWCLLLPSVKEGWGMVVTEAAACKTPSIVTNVTGLRDSVIDKKTGLVISSSPKVDELAGAMKLIIEDKKLRETFSENAAIWSKNFSWEKSYESFKSLIFE